MSDDAGGDDACWLDRVCDRCGGFVDDPAEHRCRPAAAPPDDAAQPAGDS